MTASTTSFYNHQPLVVLSPPEDAPKHDDQQHKDKQKKRKKNKKSHNDGKGGERYNGIGGAGAADGGLAHSVTGTGTPTIVIGDDDTDEENSDDDEEADKRSVAGSPHKKPKKQHEAVSSVARSSTPLAAQPSGSYSRLILRLPNKVSSSSASAVASTSAQPAQTTSTVPTKKASVPRTKKKSKKGKEQAEVAPPIAIRTSPNHPQPADESGEIPDFSLAPTFTFSACHSGESSSNDFSDLEDEDDDEGNVRGSEEAFLIAEKLKRMDRKQRKQAKRQSRTGSDDDSFPIIGGAPNVIDPSAIDDSRTGESALFEIARIRRMSDVGQRPKQSSSSRPTASARQGRRKRDSGPVTWSGGEESELGDLDELLGLTAEDFAAFSTLGGNGVSDEGTSNSAPMRFEDFLAEDDGDESDSNSSDDESSSDGDDEAGVDYDGETEDDDVFLSLDGSRLGQDSQAQETDGENEHIATTREVVQNGGFVFYRPGPDESTEDDEMTEDCLPEEAEDGGDTTDTLDDTDHVGLVRFGIEAIDKDDEDTEEALQLAMRDRTLVDARNMGLSISIDALAEQPELVVAKTARSLGVSSETAAKILTSVGMSLLMNSGGDSSTGQTSLQRKQERRERKSRIAPKPAQTERDAGAAPSASTSAVTIEEQAQPPAEQAPMKYVPVLGDFEPAGEADLCVVVGQSEMPAPSPFSARKKRRPRTFTNGSPSVGSSGPRGQSVLSSVSSQSFTSALPHHFSASSEQQYDIVLDIDDLVDPSMLPGGLMSSVSEEDEDELDDTASVSTALVQSVGDTSRWNRVPIGAFRSAHPRGSSSGPHHYAQLATAFFSGTRDPAVASTLSFHGGVAVSRQGRKKRYIPVSPVLFPVGQPLKAISHAKSRKDKRKERKKGKGKIALRQRRRQLVGHTSPSRPSDGLYVSPLFPGVASGLQIPPLSLD